jgi:ABC-type transport system involved in cytochrome c biogenesis permease subunit
MAVDTSQSTFGVAKKSAGVSVNDIAALILAPLASLKLTVVLLVMAVFVTLIATLQQASMDMWAVKTMHYNNWIVPIDFQWIFVEKWFPDLQNVPGKFYIPSGKALIVAMLINLTAAHLLRFKLQAKGMKLVLGVITAIFAAVVTWAIIFNTQNPDGFQKEPPIPYTQMWMFLQVIMLGLGVASIAGIFYLGKDQRNEKVILATFAFVVLAALGATVYFGESAFIGDYGMRILWQLAQSTIAACVGFAACILLFNRKAGIVLLHIGLAGLMVNELYVTYTNNETRISFTEGQTVSLALDIRKTELVIIDQSDEEFDEMIVIPESRLANLETVNDPQLPFTVKSLEFFDNSTLMRRVKQDSEFSGIGSRISAIELPVLTGEEVDYASAVVELSDKEGKPIGKYIVSQLLYAQDMVDTVTVDDKDYQLGLRFKTEYKPYSLKLDNTTAKYYPGTEIPKWFSSDVVLTDLESGATTEKEIYMNNPLRYGGETFYQSGYDNSDGVEQSVLQVVKNNGWMIPYVCCMFVVVGLMGQFGTSLLAFLKKNRERNSRQNLSKYTISSSEIPTAVEVVAKKVNGKRSIKAPKQNADALLQNSADKDFSPVWPAIALVLIFGIYAGNELRKAFKPVVHNEMRLDMLGEIPITHEGRVQPLDALARNTARKLSKRELVLNDKDEAQPAIRWLADTIFQAEDYDTYKLFRIEDLEVIQELSLPEKPPAGSPKAANFRYSLKQLEKAPPLIRNLIGGTEPKNWNQYQSRLAKVNSGVQTIAAYSQIFNFDPSREMGFDERIFRQVEMMREGLPRAIPTDSNDSPWTSLPAMLNQQWLVEQAKKHNVDTAGALLPKLIEDDSQFAELRQLLVREEAASMLMSMPDAAGLQQGMGARTPEEAERLIVSRWDSIPAEITKPLGDKAAKRIDAKMGFQLMRINNDQNEINEDNVNEFAQLFMKLGPAYRAGDAATFNATVEEYLAEIKSNPPPTYSTRKMATEKVYNAWSPFYLAMAIYLVAFVIGVCSWAVWPKSLGNAALWLMVLALAIHIIGLVMRVVISGRPPITNLYSSAIAVSAFFVVLMIVAEKMTKIGFGTAMGSIGAFLCLLWAWSMSIIDGDTFSVLVAVLDTQFWLSTHVVCISIGYAASFAAGAIGFAFIIRALLTPGFTKEKRREMANVIYGITCFALFCSFFGTVLGGLWGDDSWGRFWGWDPKENGALMIVLWNAVVLHSRWGGLVRERGLAVLAALGNIVVLWSWKGVNAMGVGLHAYAGSEDESLKWVIYIGLAHVVIAAIALIPTQYWMSYAKEGKA